jgi:hypothetical protein
MGRFRGAPHLENRDEVFPAEKSYLAEFAERGRTERGVALCKLNGEPAERYYESPLLTILTGMLLHRQCFQCLS